MNRRSFLQSVCSSLAGPVVALPALAVLLDAAGAHAATTPGTTPTGPASPAGAAGTASPGPDPAVRAIQSLATALHGRLVAADPTGNVVVSPSSIATALAMTLAGARATTQSEMAAVLGGVDPAVLGPSMHDLAVALTALTTDGVQVEQANSLWVQAGFAVLQPFLDALGDQFGAAPEAADFRSDPETARRAINAWVDQHTAHRIPELLGPGAIESLTRLVLVNAIWLKAAWQQPFDRPSTSPGPFRTASGATVQTPMMHQRSHLQLASSGGWSAVRLPYAGGRLAMIVALPDGDDPGLPPADLTGRFSTELVDLAMPSFDIDLHTDLAAQLAALGMPSAFDPNRADFSGIVTPTTPENRLSIGAVIHQANITVDEAGTEAAAATAVVMVAGAAPNQEPPTPIPFVVDRPFSFVVQDEVTGTVLFAGRIGDPTKRRG